jgi:cerevisin
MPYTHSKMAKCFTTITLLSSLLSSVTGVPAPRTPVAQLGSVNNGAVLRSTDNGLIGATPSSHQSGGEDYIVLFNSSHSELPHVADVLSRVELTAEHSDVHQIYNGTVLRGFCASMKSHCIDALNAMGDVAYVEKVVTVSINAQTSRANAPWGLQRISSPNQVQGDPMDLSYTYSFEDEERLGSGVDVYVIDTGVNVGHAAFGGRAKLQSYLQSQDDDNGHGTHVSGTAAGDVFGVCPCPINVFDSSTNFVFSRWHRAPTS